MERIINIIMAALALGFMSWSFAWATGPIPEERAAQERLQVQLDKRPAANTIACRDLQIFRLSSMLVHVEHNPLAAQDYNEANETVAKLLQHAEQLQKLCK